MITTRDRLREETRTIHEHLHAHASFHGLIEQTISLQRYRTLLTQLLGYHLGLEKAFHAYPIRDPTLAPLARICSDLLCADLAHLGQSAAQIDGNVSMPPPSFIQSDSDLLGCLYVREGAMIGGRSLARNLDHICGQGAFGRTFFQGTPAHGQIWRALCLALNLIEDRHAQDQIIESAQSTFGLFEAWMDGMEPIGTEGVHL
jgi:heme oxygenase (biliverdin-IX-beta and delta-forming)